MKALIIMGNKTETKVVIKEFTTESKFDNYVNDNNKEIIYASVLTELCNCIDGGNNKIFELTVTHETEYETDDMNYGYNYEIK